MREGNLVPSVVPANIPGPQSFSSSARQSDFESIFFTPSIIHRKGGIIVY